jgi:hypothetical protein
MTVTAPRAVTWEPVGPPFSSYEACSIGVIRSVDRTLPNGRRCTGQVLATRRSTKGYVIVNLTDDSGRKRTRSVHVLMMAAFEPSRPAGTVVRHWDDNPRHNVWAPGGEKACKRGLGNLVYGTPPQNLADRRRNRRPRSWSRRVADALARWL